MGMDMVVRWQRVSRSAVAELDGHSEVGGDRRGHARWEVGEADGRPKSP